MTVPSTSSTVAGHPEYKAGTHRDSSAAPDDPFGSLRKTGAWDDPPFWRSEEFVAASPWSVDELDEMFRAAARVFRREDLKLAMTKWLGLPTPCIVLSGRVFRPTNNTLRRIGSDAAVAQPWQLVPILTGLRADDASNVEGARFELETLAAIRHAGVHSIYEPHATQGGPNPDLWLDVDDGLLVELKRPGASDVECAEDEILASLAMSAPITITGIGYVLDLKAGARGLLRSVDGRKKLKSDVMRDAPAIWDTVTQLAAKGKLGAPRSIGHVVLEVRDAGGIGGGSIGGLLVDHEFSAARMFRHLNDASAQLDGSTRGVIVVKCPQRVSGRAVAGVAHEWLVDLRRSKQNIVGVIVVEEFNFADEVEVRLRYAWRQGTSARIANSPAWQAIERGFDRDFARIREWRKSTPVT